MNIAGDSLQKVVVVGASGFGRESLDVLEAMKKEGSLLKVIGVVDDLPSKANLQRLEKRGIPYLGDIETFLSNNPGKVKFILGIGNPIIRRKIASMLESAGIQPFTAIHPSAVLGTEFSCEPGVVICSGAVISTNVKLGAHVHINPNVTIGHDSELQDFVSVNPGAVVSGEVFVSSGVLIGAKAVILQNLHVGSEVVIGAAALVTKNVPNEVTVKGIPGRWNT